jgi:hypothetical protein
MLTIVGTALGLGILSPFEGWVFVAFQILVAIALIGNILSFVRHRGFFPFITGLAGAALIFFALCVRFGQVLLYLGLFGLGAASVLNYLANRRCACR